MTPALHGAGEMKRSRSKNRVASSSPEPDEHHQELVAAEAGEDVSGLELLVPGPRHRDEQPVARSVPVAVVHLLEVIEVDERDRQGDARAIGEREGALRRPIVSEATMIEADISTNASPGT